MDLDRLLGELAIKLHPYTPFAPYNTVWRFLDKRGQSILDVACGGGTAMKLINKHKRFYAMGVDISKPCLCEAKKQKAHDDYILCDIRELPIKRKSFDIVLCLEVIEHFEKEEGHRLLEEMEGIARRQVIISTPARLFPQHPPSGDNPYQEHRASWNPGELRSYGYKVRGYGLPFVGGSRGLLARLPGPLNFIRKFIWILASTVSYFAPELAGWMICVKRLKPENYHG